MELENRTAVITGAASGMGRAMAERFGTAGARIVVADIEEPAIADTLEALHGDGVDAIGVPTDVSDEAAMDALGAAARDAYGDIDIVCLNAGVGAGGPMAELRTADWEWVLGVNLWGIIHGLRVFLGPMEERNQGHVVITASVAGILSYPNMGPYNASKHAAVTIAETLHHELREKNSDVGVSVLCPGLVRTQILESDRNRPEKYRLPALAVNEARQSEYGDLIREIYDSSLSPDAVAEMVETAIRESQFYIFTDEAFAAAIADRHREIETVTNPTLGGSIIETHVRDQSRRA